MNPTVVPGLNHIVDLVDGNGSICAVRRDGSVWCQRALLRLRPELTKSCAHSDTSYFGCFGNRSGFVPPGLGRCLTDRPSSGG